MKIPRANIYNIADMICGDLPRSTGFFRFRTSKALTAFFRESGTSYQHAGPARAIWAAEILQEMLSETPVEKGAVPVAFARVIRVMMDQDDATNEPAPRAGALALLNASLTNEGLQAFYNKDGSCELRRVRIDKRSL